MRAMTANFHGTVLFGVRVGEHVFVALKPIVEAMGLNWPGQEQRVKREPVLSEGICLIHIPSAGGLQQTLGLRLDLIPGWLFTISTLRVRESIRDKINLYKRECYKVLARHFLAMSPETEDDRRKIEAHMRSISNEIRLTWGTRAAQQYWEHSGLPMTPAMYDAQRQGDLFDSR